MYPNPKDILEPNKDSANSRFKSFQGNFGKQRMSA